ncbi:transposase, partial [Brevibacillus brevis]|nr:transposase [Brevibacillus brevis]
WFLGLSLTDRVPDHTTISWNRRTRFKNTNVFQEIFDEIVRLAIQHRMVAGRVLISDSTHLKANANKRKFKKHVIEKTSRAYLKDLEVAINEDREVHGKKD